MPRQLRTWVTTDTHFNHTMLIERAHRPSTYERQIIDHWRANVHADDTIYHLGDVAFGLNSEQFRALMAALPGRKILVRGNHDRESDNWYMTHGFAYCASGVLVGARRRNGLGHESAVTRELDQENAWLSHDVVCTAQDIEQRSLAHVNRREPTGVWLTHAPQTVLPDGAFMNLHGHLHNAGHHDLPYYPPHCSLLALELTEYKPLLLADCVSDHRRKRLRAEDKEKHSAI